MDTPKKYVVHKHQKEAEPVHWDLMLETYNLLETYRLNLPPEEWEKTKTEAVKIFDHPLKFLTYQGIVNKGKGIVAITDCGTYRLVNKDENQIQISFSGKLLKGEFRLYLIKEDKWELSKV